MENRRIKRNAVQCTNCGDIIESRFHHEFVTCSCGRVSVDGGRDYLKRLAPSREAFIEMAEYEDDEDKK